MSTKEQEAQQAQTIKRIGEMLNTPWGHDVGVWVANCEDLREIVDSQAQKIVELERENLYLKRQADIHNTLMADGAKFILENKAKIAEHAKEIERLKDCMFQHMDSDTYNHCQEYLEKMRGKNENKTANEAYDV
jgi:hypothetical protein